MFKTEKVSDEVEEIARRLQVVRPSCVPRVQPCQHCKSVILGGCYALAEAVMTPIVEPEITQEGMFR